jgi:putative SOS response-associated peptidase YedK
VRNGEAGRELVMARWGMPSSQKALMDATKKRAEKLEAKGKAVDFKELLRLEPNSGTTNIRNVSSAHWKRWLAPANRCLVPLTSFSETTRLPARRCLSGSRLAMIGRCWRSQACGHPGDRYARRRRGLHLRYGFLTTEPNAIVAPIHPRPCR